MEFCPRISNMLPMCLLANASQGTIFQPRIAARNVPLLSVFHRFMRSLNLHLYTLHSIRIHWNDVQAFFELFENGTTLIVTVRITLHFIAYTLFSQKKNEWWSEKDNVKICTSSIRGKFNSRKKIIVIMANGYMKKKQILFEHFNK